MSETKTNGYMNGSPSHMNGKPSQNGHMNGKPTQNGHPGSPVPGGSKDAPKPNIFKRFSDKIISGLEFAFYKSGSNCRVNSILELWSYDETTINALNDATVKTAVNTITTSPMYYNDFDATTVLGEISRDGSGDIDSAKAAKMTFFLLGEDAYKDNSESWQKLAIDRSLTGYSGISNTYVFATRSFSDEGGNAISDDIKFLSSGYMLVIVFIWIILSRFNLRDQRIALTITGLLVVGFGLGMSFGLSSAAGWKYGPLHSILPFLLLGIGVDDLFVIHGSLNSLSHHDHQKPVSEITGRMLKHAGVSILVTSVTDVMAFGIGATTTLPALKSFCVFSCIGIVGLFCYAATFFVACVTIDLNRTRQERDGCLCCYVHKNYTPNKCSERNLLVTFMQKFYAKFLLKLPVKVYWDSIFGDFVNLEQNFNQDWFIPTDSYAYDYLQAQDKYFPDNGALANVYCKSITYSSKKSNFESLYTSLGSSQYVSNGTVDSWYKSYTEWLATNPTTHNAGKVSGAPDYWPTSEAHFADLLNTYVTQISSGQRHARELVITYSSTSSVYSIDASYVRFQHKLFANAKAEIEAMDAMQSLVATQFTDSECFPYSRQYLTWETNKVIQSELYRNLGLAAACVFVVTLILIANLWTSLMVFICVIMTLVDVAGMMHLWGLTVDTVTSINLIIAIGLAVDYSAHIGHCFMTISGERNDRVKATLVEIGAPVFSGGFSTFLAFILLAASTSYVFRTFFKVFFLVVIFGLFHGLAFLPVLLSWIGPSPYLSADKRYQDPEFKHPEHDLQGFDNKAMDMKQVSEYT
ncbi:hypothetical protein FSP39_018506 [Pinctada imbricata]|uniref:SSD domain-containing protein n=1 Tax=Pinctada imbricata TaxID=66713 RepID=A0AA89BRD7_PINIB|nr:hypothetical protein FSP39_018506 [Pinctada imbricata]